jgi:hypothetical protein
MKNDAIDPLNEKMELEDSEDLINDLDRALAQA